MRQGGGLVTGLWWDADETAEVRWTGSRQRRCAPGRLRHGRRSRRRADRIDAVNVFPVADSDTGTNVLLTVGGGADAVALVPADAPAAEVARAFGRGALLAARGNSGVIVSQYLTGLARALPAARGRTRGRARARPWRHERPARRPWSRRRARSSRWPTSSPTRRRPRPTRARTCRRRSREAVAEALRALGRISAVHPVLRAARVLDAGACALLVVLDALARAVGDERPVLVPLDWLPDGRRAPRVGGDDRRCLRGHAAGR